MLVVSVVMSLVSASFGDSSCPVYRGCLRRCLSKCPNFAVPDHRPRHSDITPFYSFPFSKLPCPLECRSLYTLCTDESNSQRPSPVKYYGKWPFTRLFGCDEFASCFFSLANAVAVLLGAKKALQFVDRKDAYFSLVSTHAAVATVVWILSAQFHARESILSESLDYFGAVSLVYITIGVSLGRRLFRENRSLKWLTVLAVMFVSHVAYLFLWKFDFGLNMTICVVLGLSTVALNIHTYLTEDRTNEPIRRVQFKLAVLSVISSMLLVLEVYDFPPIWGYLDSHALWHAVTVPVPLVYYALILDDYRLICEDKLKLL